MSRYLEALAEVKADGADTDPMAALLRAATLILTELRLLREHGIETWTANDGG